MGWAVYVARMGDRRGAHRVLMVKPDGKKPLGKPRRGWEDNIKVNLQEVRWGGMDWNDMAQDRDRRWAVVSVVMNLRVAYNAGNFLTS
jgi:hypothetical protein